MMKIKLFLFIVAFFAATSSLFAQTQEARKIEEIGFLPCGHFMAVMDGFYQELQNSTDLSLQVIFYGAKTINAESSRWNKKTNRFEIIKRLKPARGEALNRAKEIPLYLETNHNFPKDKIVLIDGGFRENLELEIWIVPKNAKSPKPSPTVEEKDIKFSSRKPSPPRNCARAYDGYE